MSGRPSGRPTKAAIIAQNLARDIATGRFAPGTALDETEIAAFYGVSRTPIREAIRQLTASGMLATRAHRGAVVRSFDEKELDDMFAVMADLEGLCARGAALSMTTAEVRALESIVDASADLVEKRDSAAYAVVNDSFHDAVYHGAHNAYLLQLTVDTRTRLAPFRRAQFDTPGRLALSLGEHRRALAAIQARDAVAAFDAMRAHIVVVRAAVDVVVKHG